MPALLALRLVTYLLVGTGIAALYEAALIGAFGAAFVVAAVLVGWGHERARERGAVRPLLGRCLVATAAVAITVDLFYLAHTVLDGMAHLLLFLILVRLFLRRGLRDLRDAGLLSFFLMVVAAAVSFGVGFLFLFSAFLALGTWMLMLHHVVSELEQAGPGPAGTKLRRVTFHGALTRVSLVAAATTFVIAGSLFFVIPRVGQAALPLRARLGKMVTGFSDRVDLGSFGDIETDRSVVMRVSFPDDTRDPATLPDLRWRGAVFDQFDGQAWSASLSRRVLTLRSVGGAFALGHARGTGPLVRQEVYLEPIGIDILFAAPHVLRMELRSPTLAFDDMGSISAAGASARLHYFADSELESPTGPGPAARAEGLSAAEGVRYLQLPPLSPAVARLAREVTAGSPDPYTAAQRLTGFLFSNYRYTLALRRETALPPVEEFLFVRRSGNCEYFAASLAVLLRSVGIPARVVAGFQRGEWNPYGRYFMVRLSDAHSWVEAFMDGRGWMPLDASPRAEGGATVPGAVSLYLDSLRMRWYRYVVNWSLRDQVRVAATVHRQASDLRVAFTWPPDRRVKPGLVIPALATGALILLWAIRRFGGLTQAGGPGAGMPGFYARALRLLARRGLRPEPAETARQFWTRVQAAAPACAAPFARLTQAYERSRFGAATLSEAETEDIARCLVALGTPARRLSVTG